MQLALIAIRLYLVYIYGRKDKFTEYKLKQKVVEAIWEFSPLPAGCSSAGGPPYLQPTRYQCTAGSSKQIIHQPVIGNSF